MVAKGGPPDAEKASPGQLRQLGLLLFILVLCALVQLGNSKFLDATNIASIFTNTAIIAILAIGMMIVMLTGGIDLSIGANIALSGMVAALHVMADRTCRRSSWCWRAC